MTRLRVSNHRLEAATGSERQRKLLGIFGTGCVAITLTLTGCVPSNAMTDADLVDGYANLGDFGSTAQQIDTEFGLEPDFADWADVRDSNCNGADGARSTLEGGFGPETMYTLSDAEMGIVSTESWAGALTSTCPQVLDLWEWDGESRSAFALADPEWERWVQPDPAPIPPTALHSGGDSDDGTWVMGVDGNGYSVRCSDGEISNSGGIQGACSGHGGVG